MPWLTGLPKYFKAQDLAERLKMSDDEVDSEPEVLYALLDKKGFYYNTELYAWKRKKKV